MAEEKLLTTPEVAERLGISTRRVLALIKDGRLPSQQFGRDHLIRESDLKLVEDRRPGRPPKQVTHASVTGMSPTKKKARKKSKVRRNPK